MNSTTKVSSKGQVIIPKAIRTAHHWEAGQELQVVDMGNGVLLRPGSVFQETSLEAAAGCLRHTGEPKSLADMENAIARGARERRS